MTFFAFALVVASAILHTAWNLASKQRRVSVSLFAWANLFALLPLVPVAVLYREHLTALPGRVWVLLVVTGLFQLAYFAGLAGAYLREDLTLIYPLARGLPVLLVSLLSFLFVSQETLPSLALLGVLVIFVGCLLLPLSRLDDWSLSRYRSASAGFVLLASLGTAGYSLTDSEALRLLREAFPAAKTWELSLVYLFGDALTTAAWLFAYSVARPQGLASAWREQKTTAAFVGASAYLTYGLVLWAMHHVGNVSYVVALRQFSIVLSVAASVLILGERPPLPRLAGALLVLAGIATMTLA